MIIVADTKEKQPLEWLNYADVQVTPQALKYGDYTLRGFDTPDKPGSIIIERKQNANELVGNLGMKWDNFELEMQRMSPFATKLVVVGSPCNFEWLYEKKFIKVTPQFLYSRMAHIQLNYGVSIMFMSNRDQLEHYLYRLFVQNIRMFGTKDE